MNRQALYVAFNGRVTLRSCISETEKGYWFRYGDTGRGYTAKLKLFRRALGGAVFNTVHAVVDEDEAFRIARKQLAEYRIWIQRQVDRADALARDLDTNRVEGMRR